MHFALDAYMDALLTDTVRRFDYRSRRVSIASWQAEYRACLLELLGVERMSRQIGAWPVAAHTLERCEFALYWREKVLLQTERGVYLPFYVLVPKSPPADGRASYDVVLALHGHSRRGKELYVGNYESVAEREEHEIAGEDIGLQAVAQGYAVVVPDVRGFGDMMTLEDQSQGRKNSCESLQRRALMFGRTLIGERVWDVSRLLDYIHTRTELAEGKVAVIGHSGGGTVAYFSAACDERIDAVVVSSYICTYEASILSISHCLCNVVPGLLTYGEMYDVATLVAPRPLLVVHGQMDQIYPIAATREAFDHIKMIYEQARCASQCEIFEGTGGHRFDTHRVWTFLRDVCFAKQNAASC